MAIKTYNPKKVTVSLGNHIVKGYADDTFITIDPSGDGITKKVGCDGEIVRAISPDDSYVIKLSLLQTSPTIGYLEERLAADRETGEGLFPILIKDLSGSLVFSSDSAWVVRSPSRAFGRDSINRECEIHTGSGVLRE